MGQKKQQSLGLEDWLQIYPKRKCAYHQDDRGLVTLKVPRARNPLMRKIIALLNPNPYITIKLDEKGSFIWNYCTGEHTIRQICQELEKAFGDSVQPSQERTVQFIKQLYRYRLVALFTHTSRQESLTSS